ncbi:LacI family DNA-binding transcriptional regulator [Streptomyces sp. NPDC058420]|uniref:LacI family DNA-binding transcriptional regulator n=1 Tax=Streptomyces sp. NPDC058420 TaxID=3346489 RepID=UPI00365D925E
MTLSTDKASASAKKANGGRSPRKPKPASASRPSTIRDVAAAAGVSSATVSRVLAGNYPVSAETKERVMAAVESLNYVMNVHAQALAGNAIGPVALVIDNILGASLAHIAAGVEQESALHNRISLICATHGDRVREDELVRLMRQQRAAAVVLVGGAVADDAYHARITDYAKALDAVGSRLVLCGRPTPPPGTPATIVEYDNRGGAFHATSYLLTAGHRRILYLGGVPGFSANEERHAGYLDALRAHGVPYAEELDTSGDFDRPAGYLRTQEAIRSGLDFTAIFASADMVAVGAAAALQDEGVKVPDEVSLIGFDDIPMAAELTPSLTTIRVPYEELGRTGVRLALEHREGRSRSSEHVILSTQLVVRDTVRRLD